MEVKQVVQRNDIFGYVMLGAPWDLAWYEQGKEPSEYGIIQTGGNYYRTSVNTIQRLSDENDFLGNLVDEYEIFLEIPLVQGKKFCDTPSLTRVDGMYCWNVGEANQVNVADIEGVTTTKTVFEFPIYNETKPDHSIIHFIPGIGISRYEYHHHGTVSGVEIRLIEYHTGKQFLLHWRKL